MAPVERILVGEIGRPHGVRGMVKLRSFTADPAAIASYGPFTDRSGERRFAITFLADGLARVEGVADREAAARLTGTGLYVDRAALPPPEEDEFYLADLVGLRVDTAAGQTLGRVKAVHDFGAGDILEVDPGEGRPTWYLPFTREAVPEVAVAEGRLVADPPADAPDDPAAERRITES